jgi:hypothetical protein
MDWNLKRDGLKSGGKFLEKSRLFGSDVAEKFENFLIATFFEL